MPSVELKIQEAKGGDLPPVCMRCEDRAEVYQHAMLHWRPWWVAILFYPSMAVYFIPSLILDSIFGRRIALRAALCERHRYHCRLRLLVLFGLFAISVLSIFVGMALALDLAKGLYQIKESRELARGAEIAGMFLIVFGYL